MNDTLMLWLLFLAAGLGTFLIRLSFIELHGSTRHLLERSRHLLAVLPPAILAALCVPAILFSRPATDYQWAPMQIVAALVTVLIARFSRSVFWPVVAGMLCLWLLNWLAG
ncbi:MAG: AzlD domain-containing protein [Marinobacterium sp.]|nr:AzlD domain-containing protein [Marinobacterium sp.]